jgi:hypothetical protein
MLTSLFLQLRKSKQYCGICKKIWHHSDGGDWVRLPANSDLGYNLFYSFFLLKNSSMISEIVDQVCCDGCNVWVHAECENISSKLFKVCLSYLIHEL